MSSLQKTTSSMSMSDLKRSVQELRSELASFDSKLNEISASRQQLATTLRLPNPSEDGASSFGGATTPSLGRPQSSRSIRNIAQEEYRANPPEKSLKINSAQDAAVRSLVDGERQEDSKLTPAEQVAQQSGLQQTNLTGADARVSRDRHEELNVDFSANQSKIPVKTNRTRSQTLTQNLDGLEGWVQTDDSSSGDDDDRDGERAQIARREIAPLQGSAENSRYIPVSDVRSKSQTQLGETRKKSKSLSFVAESPRGTIRQAVSAKPNKSIMETTVRNNTPDVRKVALLTKELQHRLSANARVQKLSRGDRKFQSDTNVAVSWTLPKQESVASSELSSREKQQQKQNHAPRPPTAESKIKIAQTMMSGNKSLTFILGQGQVDDESSANELVQDASEFQSQNIQVFTEQDPKGKLNQLTSRPKSGPARRFPSTSQMEQRHSENFGPVNIRKELNLRHLSVKEDIESQQGRSESEEAPQTAPQEDRPLKSRPSTTTGRASRTALQRNDSATSKSAIPLTQVILVSKQQDEKTTAFSSLQTSRASTGRQSSGRRSLISQIIGHSAQDEDSGNVLAPVVVPSALGPQEYDMRMKASHNLREQKREKYRQLLESIVASAQKQEFVPTLRRRSQRGPRMHHISVNQQYEMLQTDRAKSAAVRNRGSLLNTLLWRGAVDSATELSNESISIADSISNYSEEKREPSTQTVTIETPNYIDLLNDFNDDPPVKSVDGFRDLKDPSHLPLVSIPHIHSSAVPAEDIYEDAFSRPFTATTARSIMLRPKPTRSPLRMASAQPKLEKKFENKNANGDSSIAARSRPKSAYLTNIYHQAEILATSGETSRTVPISAPPTLKVRHMLELDLQATLVPPFRVLDPNELEAKMRSRPITAKARVMEAIKKTIQEETKAQNDAEYGMKPPYGLSSRARTPKLSARVTKIGIASSSETQPGLTEVQLNSTLLATSEGWSGDNDQADAEELVWSPDEYEKLHVHMENIHHRSPSRAPNDETVSNPIDLARARRELDEQLLTSQEMALNKNLDSLMVVNFQGVESLYTVPLSIDEKHSEDDLKPKKKGKKGKKKRRRHRRHKNKDELEAPEADVNIANPEAEVEGNQNIELPPEIEEIIEVASIASEETAIDPLDLEEFVYKPTEKLDIETQDGTSTEQTVGETSVIPKEGSPQQPPMFLIKVALMSTVVVQKLLFKLKRALRNHLEHRDNLFTMDVIVYAQRMYRAHRLCMAFRALRKSRKKTRAYTTTLANIETYAEASFIYEDGEYMPRIEDIQPAKSHESMGAKSPEGSSPNLLDSFDSIGKQEEQPRIPNPVRARVKAILKVKRRVVEKGGVTYQTPKDRGEIWDKFHAINDKLRERYPEAYHSEERKHFSDIYSELKETIMRKLEQDEREDEALELAAAAAAESAALEEKKAHLPDLGVSFENLESPSRASTAKKRGRASSSNKSHSLLFINDTASTRASTAKSRKEHGKHSVTTRPSTGGSRTSVTKEKSVVVILEPPPPPELTKEEKREQRRHERRTKRQGDLEVERKQRLHNGVVELKVRLCPESLFVLLERNLQPPKVISETGLVQVNVITAEDV